MSDQRIVKISPQAYGTLLKHSTRYANSMVPNNEWKVVYGFLYGIYEDDSHGYHPYSNNIVIHDAIPMTHGTYDSIEFEEEFFLTIAHIISVLQRNGFLIVGWYHSHPGKGLFLHKNDIIHQQLKFQGLNPDAITLVIDPTIVSPDSKGIEVFALDSTEIEIDLRYLRKFCEDNNIEVVLPSYHALKWIINPRIKRIKIEDSVLNKTKKKELE